MWWPTRPATTIASLIEKTREFLQRPSTKSIHRERLGCYVEIELDYDGRDIKPDEETLRKRAKAAAEIHSKYTAAGKNFTWWHYAFIESVVSDDKLLELQKNTKISNQILDEVQGFVVLSKYHSPLIVFF